MILLLRLLVLFLVVGAGSASAQQTVQFDLGGNQAPSSKGWNHLSRFKSTGLLLTHAVDSSGSATSVAVRQRDAWAGFNLNGLKDHAEFPPEATADSFFLQVDVDSAAKIDLEGLRPGDAYDLTLFGSRMGGVSTRAGVYTAGDKQVELNAASGEKNQVELKGVKADDRGVLTLSVKCKEGHPYAYLGVLQVKGSFGEPKDYQFPPERLDGPPLVTAKAWAIADGKSGELLWGENADVTRHMASTTKIMTAWIVLQLAEKRSDVLKEIVTISEAADKTSGSSAKVNAGEKLPVGDLLYGLLLPSGNDAATALAEQFGDRCLNIPDKKDATAFDRFVAEMNRQAQSLGMKGTHYLDPHGNSANRSTAQDLLRLAWTAMQNERFRRYVSTRRHECKINTGDDSHRVAVWSNTNRLLGIGGYHGVKTGTTGGAGACLVSSGVRNNDHLLVVVLGATSSDARYTDSRNLYRWAWSERAK